MDIKSPAVGKVLTTLGRERRESCARRRSDGDRVDEGRDTGEGAGQRADRGVSGQAGRSDSAQFRARSARRVTRFNRAPRSRLFPHFLPEGHLQRRLAIRSRPSSLRVAHRDEDDVGVLGRHAEHRIDFLAKHRMHARDRRAESVATCRQAKVLNRRIDRAPHRLPGACAIGVFFHACEDHHGHIGDMLGEIFCRS